ncbi:MAG TPA: DNA processing protein DprA, partial [Aldersonia sp.]
MSDERVRAWAYLSTVVAGPPHPALTALIAAVGVVEAARAVRERADLPAVLRGVTSARRHLDTADQDLATVAALGGRLVTPDDKQWPAWRLLAFSVAANAEDAP